MRQIALPKVVTAPSLVSALVWATILFVVDALLLNHGGVAATVGLIILLVRLPMLFTRRRDAFFRQRLRNHAIYLLAVALVLAANYANNLLAHQRAENMGTIRKHWTRLCRNLCRKFRS